MRHIQGSTHQTSCGCSVLCVLPGLDQQGFRDSRKRDLQKASIVYLQHRSRHKQIKYNRSRPDFDQMPGKREVSVACTQLSCSWDKEANLVRQSVDYSEDHAFTSSWW